MRVNESQDDHDLYAETNATARALDTTRPTGGIRYITDSEMLEDVFTMNDFILGMEELGGNRPRTPLRPQQETTGLDSIVPYMVTEFAGHMYPTKIYDQEERQAEHVRRHLEVLDAMYGDPQIAGAVGWCAFDYNTHKDFGSGDRICHHGIMDMYREPKFAAYVYKSQCEPDDEPVLVPVTFWARGERNIGGVLPLIVLTNCDAVEIQYGSNTPKRFTPARDVFPNLPHAPVIIDRDDFTEDELGEWGMRWEVGMFSGYVDGQKVIEKRFAADPVAHDLVVKPDAIGIAPGDSVRVMVRVVDQIGNTLPFFFEPVEIAVEGPAELFGPNLVSLRGGSVGFWLRATKDGAITAKVTHQRLGTVSVDITAARES